MAKDLFQAGARMIERVRSTNLAHSVIYVAGEDEIEINATTDQTDFELVDTDGFGITDRSRDFLFARADLTLGGVSVPNVGDLIRETIDGETIEYEVNRFGDSPHWRFDDQLNLRVRVHTKKKRTISDE